MIKTLKIDSFQLEIVEMNGKVFIFMLPKLVLDMLDYYRWRLAQNQVCQEYRDNYELDESDHFNTGHVHVINRHNLFLFNHRELDSRITHMLPDDSNYYIFNIKKCGGKPQPYCNNRRSEAQISRRILTDDYYYKKIVNFY